LENFVKTLTVIADLVGYSLTEEVIALYLHHMQGKDLEAAAVGLQRLSRSLKPGKGFPSVDEILESMGDGGSADEDKARDAASLIVAAVRRFGSVRQENLVEEYVGPLAWAVVKRQGGWLAVCESLTNQNIGLMQSQWRDLAKSLCSLNRHGELRHIELPESTAPNVKKLVADLCNKLPPVKP